MLGLHSGAILMWEYEIQGDLLNLIQFSSVEVVSNFAH